MAHGAPDWGIGAPKRTVYALQDVAELAARLGSIVTFDRRGDVIWIDDFEDNINKWALHYTGTGSSIALSTDTARNGAQAAKLIYGDAVGDVARITRYLPLPVLSKIGFEISFTAHATQGIVYLNIRLRTGEEEIEGAVRYRFAEDDYQYYDSTGAWRTFTTYPWIYPQIGLFHTWKLVIDPIGYRYVRLIVNNVVHDMSALPLRVVDSALSPQLRVRLQYENTATGNVAYYVDDAVVTQNEP